MIRQTYITTLCSSLIAFHLVGAGEGERPIVEQPAAEWFVDNKNGETLYSRAAEISKTNKTVVIAIYVSKEGYEKAVSHASKISEALNKVGTSSKTIVQIHDGEGVGFSYYASGFGVYDSDLGDKGVFSPKNAIRILPKVVALQRSQPH